MRDDKKTKIQLIRELQVLRRDSVKSQRENPVGSDEPSGHALAGNEQLFCALFEQANDAIFLHDMRGRILDVNPTACQRLGYSRAELLLLSVGDIDSEYFEREDQEKFWQRLHPDSPVVFETRHRRKDGSLFPVEVSLSPIQHNEQQFVLSVVRDMSERKQTEAQLQIVLREKELLLREIHHRTQNVMTSIISLLGLQTMRNKEPHVRELLQSIESRVRAMALVQEKLYKSKSFSQVDLKEYLEDLALILAQNYEMQAGEISLRLELDSLPVGPDIALPCGLILNELLTNALRYAFPTGQKGEIRVFLRNGGDTCEFGVADNGVGLPKEFEIGTSRSLGLQLVSLFVEHQLQGVLEINGTTQKGTSVVIRFIPETAD